MSWLKQMKEKQRRKRLGRAANLLASDEYQETLQVIRNGEGATEEAWKSESRDEDGREA